MKKIGEGLLVALTAILLLLAVLTLQNVIGGKFNLAEHLAVFTTIFLGIFIEAAPFLLLGALGSGLVEVFLSKEKLQNSIPRNPLAGALTAGMMGFVFPVCECGVVPLTRRLFRKGLPPNIGITFLLASPIINPIVIASTYSAFGWGPVLWLRIGLSLLIAVSVGFIFSFQKDSSQLFNLSAMTPAISLGGHDHGEHDHEHSYAGQSIARRVLTALQIAAEEFLDMGRYLIIGAMLAALMQTVVPQSHLLALGGGKLLSILVMIVLAVVLSICSTVDAFIALSFVGVFTTGSILSFLVYGPMVDIKSTLMYLQVFNRKTVVYLVTLPLLMSVLASALMNYYTAW